MNDPYITLGVSEDATDEEIKDAYRALVRKYHPDNYQADSPLAEWATKKMKEINEAYDEIRRRRTREGARAEGAGAPASFAEIRRLINASRFGDARRELSRYPRENQPAEWHFLFSIVLMHDGAVNDGLRELDTACEREPGNIE